MFFIEPRNQEKRTKTFLRKESRPQESKDKIEIYLTMLLK